MSVTGESITSAISNPDADAEDCIAAVLREYLSERCDGSLLETWTELDACLSIWWTERFTGELRLPVISYLTSYLWMRSSAQSERGFQDIWLGFEQGWEAIVKLWEHWQPREQKYIESNVNSVLEQIGNQVQDLLLESDTDAPKNVTNTFLCDKMCASAGTETQVLGEDLKLLWTRVPSCVGWSAHKPSRRRLAPNVAHASLFQSEPFLFQAFMRGRLSVGPGATKGEMKSLELFKDTLISHEIDTVDTDLNRQSRTFAVVPIWESGKSLLVKQKS